MKYYNQEGKAVKKPLSGFLSKLFQHEVDHLNGKLMIESKKIVDWTLTGIEEKEQTKYINFIKEYTKLIKVS